MEHPAALLDLVIGIDEGQAQAMGQALADAALARAHQPDEHDGLRRCLR